MFGFLVYRTGDRLLAEEIVSETFTRAFAARSRFDRRRATEKTWLYSIALNLVRDHARRSQSQERALDRVAAGGAASSDDLNVVDERLTLAAAMEALSAEEREALALRYGGDLTAPELAAALGEPLTTVEGRIYRGLRKLRASLEAGGEPDFGSHHGHKC